MTSIVPITRGLSAFRRGVLKLQKKVSSLVPAVLEQAFFFGGIASVSYGAWMIYKPLGPIIGGVAGVWISFLIAADRVAAERQRRRPG